MKIWKEFYLTLKDIWLFFRIQQFLVAIFRVIPKHHVRVLNHEETEAADGIEP